MLKRKRTKRDRDPVTQTIKVPGQKNAGDRFNLGVGNHIEKMSREYDGKQ